MANNLPVGDRAKYDKLKNEWGEGTKGNVVNQPTVTPANREIITMVPGTTGAINSTERQKQRTFVEGGLN